MNLKYNIILIIATPLFHEYSFHIWSQVSSLPYLMHWLIFILNGFHRSLLCIYHFLLKLTQRLTQNSRCGLSQTECSRILTWSRNNMSASVASCMHYCSSHITLFVHMKLWISPNPNIFYKWIIIQPRVPHSVLMRILSKQFSEKREKVLNDVSFKVW